MKKILVVLLVMALFCAPALAGDTLNPNFTKQYENKKGVVTFNHQTHAEQLGECASCHNKFDELIKLGEPMNKKFAHDVCKACHRLPEYEAPTRCTGCHIK